MLNRLHLRPLDFLFFAVSLAACIGALLFIKKSQKGTPLLVADTPGGEYVYPLDKDNEIRLAGAIGTSIIMIKDGKASFLDSPCPNKTCVQCKPIKNDGEWIACMPNQVFIRVESKENSSVDIVSQ